MTSFKITIRLKSLLLVWVVFIACPSMLYAKDNLKVSIQQDTLHVDAPEHPLLVYKFSNTPFKPYVQKLFTPTGKNILRDAPHDHLHHHALMFAVSLNGISFWEESENAGKQEHQSFQQLENKQSSRSVFRESLVWKNPANEILANEFRTIQVEILPKQQATLLTWETSLVPGKGAISVGGSHYYGLGMRFIESMDKIGAFTNSENADGDIFRGEERLTNANWCAYSVIGEFPATVCMMNDPQNKRPATWFTMPTPFSYLSATLRYHEKPFEITKDSPLNLRYAVAVWDGIKTNKQIEMSYQEWIQRNIK
ncbi:MAG: PmoA family protein [Candidatus Hinthialibacter antarcticus]|nr:PmoA family protein [Candidatus Hinthialibacter antarcticus]